MWVELQMRAGVRAEFFSFNFTFATKFCFALDLFDMVASFLKLSRTTPTNNPAMFRHIADSEEVIKGSRVLGTSDDVPLALPFFVYRFHSVNLSITDYGSLLKFLFSFAFFLIETRS